MKRAKTKRSRQRRIQSGGEVWGALRRGVGRGFARGGDEIKKTSNAAGAFDVFNPLTKRGKVKGRTQLHPSHYRLS